MPSPRATRPKLVIQADAEVEVETMDDESSSSLSLPELRDDIESLALEVAADALSSRMV